MDFVADTLFNCRRLCGPTVVDDSSKECPALEVDHSLTGNRVLRVLECDALIRRLQEVITVDNGPKFISKALEAWAYANGVKLNFIQRGQPAQNCFTSTHLPACTMRGKTWKPGDWTTTPIGRLDR